jgi:hypothetical protein
VLLVVVITSKIGVTQSSNDSNEAYEIRNEGQLHTKNGGGGGALLLGSIK